MSHTICVSARCICVLCIIRLPLVFWGTALLQGNYFHGFSEVHTIMNNKGEVNSCVSLVSFMTHAHSVSVCMCCQAQRPTAGMQKLDVLIVL